MANNALTMRRECSNIFYMSNYLSSLGYPFRERPMVFVFSVLIVWAMSRARLDCQFLFSGALYVRLLHENGEAVRHGR